MLRRSLALLLPLAALLAAAPGARAAAFRPGEVVVRDAGSAEARVVRVPRGRSVEAAARELRARPGIASAAPNYLARAAGFIPRDPGVSGLPGGWQAVQWNFLPGAGVDAPSAWRNVIRAGAPGGRGVVVAVLDTGVAYQTRGPYRRSPDFSPSQFVPGRDFVDGDAHPDDPNGHGTHAAGTIAERTGNGVGRTGLAYGAKLMPVRVLDRYGEGDVLAIARGIRWAARHGADVANLSLEFDASVGRRSIPEIIDALRYARRRGMLVVGAAGNTGAAAVAYPARAADVLAVGATTQHRCAAAYANRGSQLDLVAPGGGDDAPLPGDPDCQGARGEDVYQLTYDRQPVWSQDGDQLIGGSLSSFGLPGGYEGTSMAAPHVAGIAALVIASRVLGRDPSPVAVIRRLEATARDLGVRGWDRHFGWGLVDAGRATDPAVGRGSRLRRA